MHRVRNSSWNPTLFVLPNKNYLKEERKILIVKEFLFGDVQIGFKSQELLYKVSCMELGTPHETQSYLFYLTKIQIWEWGRKRFWEEEDRWNPIYKPMLSAWCYSLYPWLFFFLLSMSLLYVCNCSLFVFPPLTFFFFFFSFRVSSLYL